MKRYPIKKVAIEDLKTDGTVNVRESEAYKHVQALAENIAQVGAVLEPLHVRKEDNIVLRGNMRLAACNLLLSDPNITASLRDAIHKLDVLYVEGLDERETLEYVLDHGNVTPLTRVETVLTCWKLQKQMKPTKEIGILLYRMLGNYSGNNKKALEVQNMPLGPDRDKVIATWLHGTLGDYILRAGQMGPIVREQFILTDRALDRPLTDDEKKLVLFKCDRKRIADLNKAKMVDEKSTEGWSQKDGGTTFNALIAKYTEEDKTGKKSEDRGPTKTEMKTVADACNSDAAGLIYRHCAGDLKPDEKAKIDAIDTEMFRMEEIKKATHAIIDRVDISATFSGAEVREVLKFFIGGGNTEYAEYIKRFVTKS